MWQWWRHWLRIQCHQPWSNWLHIRQLWGHSLLIRCWQWWCNLFYIRGRQYWSDSGAVGCILCAGSGGGWHLLQGQFRRLWWHSKDVCCLRLVISKLISRENIWSIFCEIALRWTPLHTFGDESASIVSCNILVPPGNKPLIEPMLSQMHVIIWCYKATMRWYNNKHIGISILVCVGICLKCVYIFGLLLLMMTLRVVKCIATFTISPLKYHIAAHVCMFISI